MIPTSQRTPATRWDSHKDQAAKALRKLAGPHLPATLTQLEKAIARAHHDAIRIERQPQNTAATEASPNTESDQDQRRQEDGEHELVDVVGEDASAAEVTGAVASDGSVNSDADPRL